MIISVIRVTNVATLEVDRLMIYKQKVARSGASNTYTETQNDGCGSPARLARGPPKPWNFLSESDKVAFGCAREVTLGPHWRARINQVIGAVELSGPLTSGEGWGAAETVTSGQRLSQSRLRNEAPTPPPRTVPRPLPPRASAWATGTQLHATTPPRQAPSATGTEATSRQTSPCVPLHLAVGSCPLTSFVINQGSRE